MAANLNNTKNKTCELQADKYKNVREFFKYLKIKSKFKKTLGKIWFNKQCLINKQYSKKFNTFYLVVANIPYSKFVFICSEVQCKFCVIIIYSRFYFSQVIQIYRLFR